MKSDCCSHSAQAKSCKRKDGRTFSLPRRFSRKRCAEGVRGFTMRSSCAPYSMCGGGNQNHSGIAVLDMNGVTGTVRFEQLQDAVRIKYNIKGLTDGKHGFHIHEFGDLTDGCKNACSHFNPDGGTHGGLNSRMRHAGDLGNIVCKKGKCSGHLTAKGISLNPRQTDSIIGRSIIIHADEDDLGKGGNIESIKTGNAGKRLACAVIGISK